jgi:hypothetical protein
MKRLALLLLAINMPFTSLIKADNKVDFDGSISIGYLNPSDNSYFKEDGGESVIITENVLRVTAQLKRGFAISGQALYREAGDNYDGGLKLDFLQIDYRSQLWGEGQQTATFGRFKSRQGLYNETRDVPSTRPSILLPQSVYLDTARNFFLTLDGIKFRTVHPYDNGDLSFEIALGENSFDDKFSTMALGKTAEGNWSSETNRYFDIRYESSDWVAAANFAWVGIDYRPKPGAYLPIRVGNLEIPVATVNGKFDSLMSTYSIQYTFHPLEITLESNRREFDSRGFSPGSPPSELTMGGQYIQFRWFVNEQWTALYRYDEFYSNTADQNGENLLTSGNSKRYANSKDKTIGLTWRPNAEWFVSFEYHFLKGGAWLPPLGKGSALPPLVNNWDLAGFQIAYLF